MKPICKTYPDGTKVWCLNNVYHRTDGPAVERPQGTKVWYLKGKCHRINGPAIEWANGHKEWYLYGEWFETKQAYIKASLKRKLITQEEAFILSI